MQIKEAVTMAQKICQRYERYTKGEVLDTIVARKAQAMIGHPTNAQFHAMVRKKTKKNCPIKSKQSTNAHSIFGSSIAGVQEKQAAVSQKE